MSHRRPDIGTLLPLQCGPRSGFLLNRVFPIEGISLRGPIRGTGTGGKLNLIIIILLTSVLIVIEPIEEVEPMPNWTLIALAFKVLIMVFWVSIYARYYL